MYMYIYISLYIYIYICYDIYIYIYIYICAAPPVASVRVPRAGARKPRHHAGTWHTMHIAINTIRASAIVRNHTGVLYMI